MLLFLKLNKKQMKIDRIKENINLNKLTRASQHQDHSKEGGVLLQVFPRQQHNLENQNNMIIMENR